MRSVWNSKKEWMMHRNRHIQTTLHIKGVGLVEVVTVTGLGRIIGKSRNTVLRYEQLNVFPMAPIMVGNIRYYPLSLARRLVPLVRKIPGNRKPDADLLVEIDRLFKDEKNKLLCQQKQ